MEINVTVKHENGRYVLYDENGSVYGRYDSKGQAEEAADGWNNYYKEDL